MQNSIKQNLTHKKRSSYDAIVDHCLDIDIFGRQVKLTFNGKDKLRTRFGTFCTVVIAVIIMVYITLRIPDIFNYKNALPVISQMPREVFSELYQQDYMNLDDKQGRPVHEYLGDSVKPKIFFAFGLGYYELIDPQVGHFIVTEVS